MPNDAQTDLVLAAEAAVKAFEQYARSYELSVDTVEELTERLRTAVARIRARYVPVED